MAITGIGINSSNPDVKEQEDQLGSILAAINAQNKALVEEEERQRQEEQEREFQKQKEIEEEERAKINKERFDKEQEEKRIRTENERKEKEEAEKIKERNPFYSALKKFEKNKPVPENPEDEPEEETETYAAFIARNALEKSGDILRSTKETIGKKKHDIVQSVTQKLSKIGGFEAPEFTEYNPSEEFAKKMEQKQIRKEEKEARRKEMEEKKRQQKEEQARITQEKKEAAEKKKAELELAKKERAEAKRREAEARAAEEKKKEELKLEAQRQASERAFSSQAPVQQPPQQHSEARPNQQNPSQTPKEPLTPEEYDKYLSEEARNLKMLIRKEHVTPDFSVTEHAVNEIQKMRDVVAVIIASADMNHLFIFHEPATFIELATKLNKTMNYSYIYVVTTTAPVYFGADRCYHGLTEMFEKIREIILRYGHINRGVLLKVDGISMFKNIHLDA